MYSQRLPLLQGVKEAEEDQESVVGEVYRIKG